MLPLVLVQENEGKRETETSCCSAYGEFWSIPNLGPNCCPGLFSWSSDHTTSYEITLSTSADSFLPTPPCLPPAPPRTLQSHLFGFNFQGLQAHLDPTITPLHTSLRLCSTWYPPSSPGPFLHTLAVAGGLKNIRRASLTIPILGNGGQL